MTEQTIQRLFDKLENLQGQLAVLTERAEHQAACKQRPQPMHDRVLRARKIAEL